MGVGSNLIVRDGGIAGVVVRLGRGFNGIRVEGDRVVAGLRRSTRMWRGKAAEAGIDLTFLRTIPGLDRRGGADERRLLRQLYRRRLRLGAGGDAGRRDGGARRRRKWASPIARRALPDGLVVTEVTLAGPRGEPEALARQMEEQLARRDASQPVEGRARRARPSAIRRASPRPGGTDDVHDLKAWKLIEDAGMKGATLGGAQMSPKHGNFLVNAGGAKAADLENLGELVRKKVLESTGITLEWEIMRVGRP